MAPARAVFQRHGALSRLGLILPAPCLYGGPVSGNSLLEGLLFLGHWTTPLNADVPVLGVTWGSRVSDPFPFLVMPGPSYSGIVSGAPPPWLLGGLSLSFGPFHSYAWPGLVLLPAA